MKNKHSGLFGLLSKMSKYAKLLKTVKICYNSYLTRFMRMQISGYIPLYVHMYTHGPSVCTMWVWVPL